MKKDIKEEVNLQNGLLVGGSGLVGLGAIRKYHQAPMRSSVVDVVGGSTGVPTEGSIEYQRNAWVSALSDYGGPVDTKEGQRLLREGKLKEFKKLIENKIDVRSYSSRLGYSTKGGKHFDKAPLLQQFEHANYTSPAAEIHTSKYDKNPLGLLFKRLFTGKNYYRILTDMGPGGLEQKSSGGWNQMKAHRGPIYNRFVVPGGDTIKTPNASHPNVNVSSIPVPADIFHVKTNAPTNSKVEVLLNAGGGSGWPGILPQPGQKEIDNYVNHALKTRYRHISEGKDIDKLRIDLDHEYVDKTNRKLMDIHVESLNKAFGNDNYHLNILSGPAAPDSYKTLFKNLESENKNISFVESVKRESMPEFISKHNILVMPTGSTIAEVASFDGYKPKILSIVPRAKDSFGNHFSHNADWYKENFGGLEKVIIDKGDYNSEAIAQKLKDLHAAPDAKTQAIRFNTADAKKVIDVIDKDFKASKRLTNKFLLAGAGVAGIGGAIKLLKNRDSKPVMEKKADLNKVMLNSVKDFKGGKARYIGGGAAIGALLGLGTGALTDKNLLASSAIGVGLGSLAGGIIGKKTSPILIFFTQNEAEGKRLFSNIGEYPSTKEVVKNLQLYV